jgi:hypothetical protein
MFPIAGEWLCRPIVTRSDVDRIDSGRPAGFLISPSIGLIVSQQRGRAMDGVPACVGIGYPNATRWPGFFGAQAPR